MATGYSIGDENWVDEVFPAVSESKREEAGELEYTGNTGSDRGEFGSEDKVQSRNWRGGLNVGGLDLQPSKLQEKLQDQLELHQQSSSEATTPGDSKRLGSLQSAVGYWNLFGLLSYFRKDKHSGDSDDWEIPFEDIRDLEFVGSGSQGAC